MTSPIELVCPAGGLPALKAAVDNGADCVYTGLKDATNARAFGGMNFDDASLREGIRYARDRGAKVLLAVNTYPQVSNWSTWTAAIDRAADLGVYAVILADPGLMAYAHERHPELRLHLSVQGSATNPEAIEFYRERFDIQRAVLPRVLSVAQVSHVIAAAKCEIEVFGYGGLCVMVEGRCALSAYATGDAPNTAGVCSPARAVRWEQTDGGGMDTRLNGVLIDRFGAGEKAGYPTLCKGRFDVADETYYALEEPTSLNTIELLPRMLEIGVRAVKIEGRQRSTAYVAAVTRTWRDAIDAAVRDPERFAVRESWMRELDKLSEGRMHTLGAYYRPWR